MWKFEVYEDQRGEYRWRLKAANGRIVGDSGEGYSTKSNAKQSAERAGRSIATARIVDA